MTLNLNNMNEVAEAMVAPGKGILAADESTGTIGKRFDQINTESTDKKRNAYRDLLFSSKVFKNILVALSCTMKHFINPHLKMGRFILNI